MSDNRDDLSGLQREMNDNSRAEPAPPPGADQNTPAKASLQLLAAAWLLSIFSALRGWWLGPYVSEALVLAALVAGIWGLRRAAHCQGAGKRLAIAGLVGAAVTILLPIPLLWYVYHQREQAALLVEKNHLKQIGLGEANQESAYSFLAPTVYDAQREKFNSDLSWRVDLLPFIEAGILHLQFRRDEAWDGPTNRQFADLRVPQFISPFDAPGTTRTRYHVFVGGGAMFEYWKKTKLTDIADGTSNTIMVAEARNDARWPQPFDLPYSADQPLPPLGRADAKGFMVVMADGSVRFVRKEVTESTLRSAITAAGNDTLGPDW
jgi:hypothetical protein